MEVLRTLYLVLPEACLLVGVRQYARPARERNSKPRKAVASGVWERRQALRLSRNTACSPNRFQNHQGAFRRSRLPQALRATALSILAPDCSHNWRKSLM